LQAGVAAADDGYRTHALSSLWTFAGMADSRRGMDTLRLHPLRA